ncbi:MAG TPA: sensor domain-containing diguanylate cyclase [Candidatus Limnocylindria bacterium]
MRLVVRMRLRSQRALAVGLAGAAVVWLAELIAGPGELRHYIADLGWTGFALGAVVGTARAALVPRRNERVAWAFIFLGATAWAVGQLFWDLYDIAGITVAPPAPSDIARLTAAAFFVIGCAAFLAGHEQRLAIYALVLDVGAAVLTMLAGVALYVADLFAPEMIRQPATIAVGLAYPVLYVAATGAALSMFWGLPPQQTRRAHLSLLLGVSLNTVGFVLWLPDYVHQSFAPGSILDLFWMTGILMISIAGLQWAEDSAGEVTPFVRAEAVQFSRMLLPGAVAVLAAAILIASQFDRQTATDPLIAAAIALTIVVLALRAGLALYSNWRLGIRERRRATQFAALYDVGLATAGEISLDDLAQLAVDNAIRLTQTDGAMIALADPDGGYTVRATNRSNMPELRDAAGEQLVGIALECLRTREAAVATEYHTHADANPRLHGVIRSALALPLIAHGDIVGTMTLYSGRPRHWGAETQRLFRLYAAQAAIAIANARLLGESRRLASDDPLTGLTNRRVLVERLEAETAEARRHGDAFCVILCDVDGLKAVNDTAGHLVGDSVLRSVATTLRTTARTEDVVARFGGDEFVLLLPRTALDAARSLVMRLTHELPERTYMWAGTPHALPRVSFGIAAFPEDGLLTDQLIAKADERMYADKARARGRLS